MVSLQETRVRPSGTALTEISLKEDFKKKKLEKRENRCHILVRWTEYFFLFLMYCNRFFILIFPKRPERNFYFCSSSEGKKNYIFLYVWIGLISSVEIDYKYRSAWQKLFINYLRILEKLNLWFSRWAGVRNAKKKNGDPGGRGGGNKEVAK